MPQIHEQWVLQYYFYDAMMIDFTHYHYGEDSVGHIGSYVYGSVVGNWWMPSSPALEGIFDMHPVLTYEPNRWSESSPSY